MQQETHLQPNNKKIIGHRSEKIMGRIWSLNSLSGDDLLSTKIDNVYIDEALFCNKYKLWKAYKNIFLFWNCNIIAYSTSDRLYSEELITLTKFLKHNPDFDVYIRAATLQEIREHYWANIITEDFEIIAPHNKYFSEERFRTGCMGEFHETT